MTICHLKQFDKYKPLPEELLRLLNVRVMGKFNYLGNLKKRGEKRTLLCGRQLPNTENTSSSLKG